MKKLTKKQYEKQAKELADEYASLINHHVSRIFLRFANDIVKLNSQFFEMKCK